jgi:paraquat-inducible protein A
VSAMPATATQAGLLSCLSCHFVSRAVEGGTAVHCPRCGAKVRHRKAYSLSRTWAYLIAAYALYIPANVLPIMDSRSLFLSQEDTILSGVRFLWTTGSYVTASLIFFASIVEPLLKLFGLTALVLKVQRHSRHIGPGRASRIFRLIHVVGRWSMLDIFVAAILVALVQSPTLAQIAIGPAAVAFGAVVILTMLAALSFDPRCLWDENPRHG